MPVRNDDFVRSGKRYIGRRKVALRYDVDVRTTRRWQATGLLPDPDFHVGEIGFWSERRLDEFDAARPKKAASRGRLSKATHTEI
jgi:hypothetical protein